MDITTQDEEEKKEDMARALNMAALFNFFMEVNDDNTIPGVRPSGYESENRVELRLLPASWDITIKILDLYTRKLNLFTPEEIIAAGYATTVKANLINKRGAFLAAVSFFFN